MKNLMIIYLVIQTFIVIFVINTTMKRSAKEILEDLTPAKSANCYNSAWSSFFEFIKKDTKPTEDDFIEYFDYLRHLGHPAVCSTPIIMFPGQDLKQMRSTSVQMSTNLRLL